MWSRFYAVKLFLASSEGKQYLKDELMKSRYLLTAFFYYREWQRKLIKSTDMFLLDSGAFTFMSNSKGAMPDWNDYISQYIRFINENDIQYFFELDIDCLVGYDKVKEYRKRIECQTQKQAIPVWHKSRGIEEFKNLCAEYSYVAIGGFAIKDIKPAEYKYIHSLLSYARAHNTKVHGLGFTPADVEKYDFYSVDSSSWTIGSRYARIYLFKDGRMTQVGRPANTRLKDYKVLDAHNLKQWIRFQQYLDR